MIERRRIDRLALGTNGRSELLHEREVGRRVKGEGSAAARVSRSGVGQRGELGAAEMIAVQGNEGCDDSVTAGRGVLGMQGVESSCDRGGEGCLS